MEAEFRWRVGMLQQMHQLQRFVVGRACRGFAPCAQEFRRADLLGVVVRRFGQFATAVAQQVIDQRQPAPRGDRQHLMRAIGVERGERRFGRVVAAQVETSFTAAMTHQQFAALAM